MTQVEMMLDFMRENGSITGYDAFEMGIMNYKGRINDLRKLGFPIKTTWESRVNSAGVKKTYARYTLESEVALR